MVKTNHKDELPKGSMAICFKNRYMVSVVYGFGMYSSPVSGSWDAGYSLQNITADPDMNSVLEPAGTVEVAIFDPNGQMVPFQDGNQVKGRVTPDELMDIMMWVRNLPPLND